VIVRGGEVGISGVSTIVVTPAFEEHFFLPGAGSFSVFSRQSLACTQITICLHNIGLSVEEKHALIILS